MRIFAFQTVSSTMDKAYALATEDSDLSFCVIAQTQYDGVGTHGRLWHSPKGNFYATFCFKELHILNTDTAKISLLAGLAVAKTLSHYDINVKLKWSNDLMIAQHKVGGVLCTIREQAVFIGIGINFKQAPVNIHDGFFSAGKIGIEIDFSQFAKNLGDQIMFYLAQDFQTLHQQWHRYAAFIDQVISVKLPDDTLIKGVYKGIDKKGFLAIENQGVMRYLHSARIISVE